MIDFETHARAFIPINPIRIDAHFNSFEFDRLMFSPKIIQLKSGIIIIDFYLYLFSISTSN